ncbi:MAG: DNA-3-methyladenine glycosylase I [Holosporaceae bacterium]|jgi:DNA-3-methyladenine glycosylase I|nr:DNA-3-methyladenine glycosylase I [Holosporaceae bacterium]
MTKRCIWATSSILEKYHDEEWGKPLHDDQRLFEMLVLEGKSCGLSWEIVLKKRDHMRKAFDNFNPNIISQYDTAKVDELMQDAGIIKHRAKIEAVICNAKAYLNVKNLHGSLDNFLWSYVNHQPIITEPFKIITKNELSDRLSKDLKKLGFKFVGSVITYSFMQAIGMVNDHEPTCPWR